MFLGAAGATLAPGTNPSAHANLILDEGDWNGVLFGDFTGLAPLVAGRAFPSRDEANRAALCLIVMYIFAHIPAGADNDPAILAVIYAGSTMTPGVKLASAVRSFQDRPEATVIGRNRFGTSARQAAMANSFLAQLLEWEDWTFLAHSGASIVPVVLAVGELAGASGATVLTAIVAGNEIVARAGEFLTDVLHTGNALAIHQLELPLLAAKLLGL